MSSVLILCKEMMPAGTMLSALAVRPDLRKIGNVDTVIGEGPAERKIGRYRVLKLLGSGGMGEVYLAEDPTLCRRVALKLIRPDILGSSGTALPRFLREARATAALNHPNIAVLYEAGGETSEPFLAMEYVDGRNLKEQISSELPDSAKMLQWALQIASALDHAHSRGIIHRDIKSANIALTRDGSVKLLDFGLALSLDAVGETQTTPGALVGTLQYMAPELFAGEPADARTDIYAFGLVLHELASGRIPFEGLTGGALVNAILTGRSVEISPARLSSVQSGWVQLIARAMSLQPQERFGSAAEMIEALKRLEGSGGATHEEAGSVTPLMLVWEFQNLSGDADTDWLGTGLAETLTADLAKVKSVRVVSREQARNLLATSREGKTWSPELAAQRLGARFVVTGSYQRAGSRIRITPRVLEAGSGNLVATAKLDGAWEDIFDLQDRVVTELMASLQLDPGSTPTLMAPRPDTVTVRAYEHFCEGNRKLQTFDKSSLEEARLLFEKAVQLDQTYASAYAGMGNVHAMRFIYRGDPVDLERAGEYLEKALRLDPELADPYALLSYVYGRQGRIQEALDAGRKAVELQPHYYLSHYFLGVAFLCGHEENPDAYLQRAADCMAATCRLDPCYEPAWILRLATVLNAGDVDGFTEARDYLGDLERRNMLRFRFPGAGMLTGAHRLRQLKFGEARSILERTMADLEKADHMYRETQLGITQCVEGELELRCGNADRALIHFRKAWQTTREFPLMMGCVRISVRAQAGLAASYAASGSRDRAIDLIGEARSLLGGAMQHPEYMIVGGFYGDLCHALAVSCARSGERETALEFLETAVEKGWRDADWLTLDPEFASIRDEPRFRSMIDRIRRAPRLQSGALPPIPPVSQ